MTPTLTQERADLVFQALADATRRDILQRVLAEPTSVSVLAESYSMSFAAVQKHVAVLERAGLLHKKAQGRRRLAIGDAEAVREVTELLQALQVRWADRSRRIDDLLAQDAPPTDLALEAPSRPADTTDKTPRTTHRSGDPTCP